LVSPSLCQREEELLSYWWKEYAECSEGPKGQTSSNTEADLPQSSQACELYAVEEERVGVPVKGGLYEVLIFSSFVGNTLSTYDLCFLV